ncbi:MAG: hypothetical protein OES09_05715, partial [Gammaproteobacteria bacterium]|nr:hypothetical protein [Gammaproteobacteria bacterium]
DAIKGKTQSLAEASHKLAEEMYKRAAAEEQAGDATESESAASDSPGGDDNVVDAEFEEVKDNKENT